MPADRMSHGIGPWYSFIFGDLHFLPPRDQRVFENLHAWTSLAKAAYRQYQIDNEM